MAKEEHGKPTWYTKQEAAKIIGCSIRSVERLVEHGEIKQKFLKVANRRPIAILDPADVEKQKARETLETVPPSITEQMPALVPRAGEQPDLLTTLAHSWGEIQGHPLKMFLTLEEASDLSGLTKTYLRRLIAAGRLAEIRDRGIKVRRSDLLRL